MTVQEYFGKSKGTFPKVGVIGVASEWMWAGPLEVPHGDLWAGDPHIMDKRTAHIVKVPQGIYAVLIQGMDFKGHRRTARVRACHKDVAGPRLGKSCGQTGTDSAWIGVCDYAAYKKAVGKSTNEYEKDILQATKQPGIGVVTFECGGKTFEMALLPSGLGDGSFTVYPLLSRGKTVGFEIEFIPPGFKLEQALAGAGGGTSSVTRNRAEARAFLSACKKGDITAVKRLLKKDPEIIHSRGRLGLFESASALQIVANHGHAALATLLIVSGHPVDSRDQFGNTPLMDACSRGTPELVRVLIKHKANANARDSFKETPLHEAAYPKEGRAEMVRLLLAAGADPNARDERKRTPLSLARGYLNHPAFTEGQNELKKIIDLLTGAARKK